MSRYLWQPERHALGIEAMDRTHAECLALARALEECQQDQLAPRFAELIGHTEAHFAAEEARMQASACPSTPEHQAEHRRVLGDLRRFASSLARGRPAMLRAYLAEGFAEWLEQHVATMDAALAAHLKACGES